MDAVPSTSALSPPKKRKRLDLGALSVVEKQSVINMYKLLKQDGLKCNAAIHKIVDSLGVARSTVFRTIKEYKDTGKVSCPKRLGGRPSITDIHNETTKYSVRQIVHSFFFKNEIPTLNKILKEVKDREDLPNMSRSTLYTLLKDINFKFMKRNRKSILIEREDIIVWRRKYLRTMRDYRKEGKLIYYLDETWVNEGHTKDKVWTDTDIKTKRDRFIQGLSAGLTHPSGKGRRLILLHVGSELGFVDGHHLLFEGKKTGDYHDEMNSTVFEHWFENLLKSLPNGAVIVMDNASYHSRKLEKVPTTCSTKCHMRDWLKSKNIPFDNEMVKTELMQIIRMHKDKYNSHVVDVMAQKHNKTVLRLPPYHCELNPIELIWAQIKNEIASKNNTFKLVDVRKLLFEAMKRVTDIDWKKCIEHVRKEEDNMYKLDHLMDLVIEPLIIHLGSSDSDSSSSDE